MFVLSRVWKRNGYASLGHRTTANCQWGKSEREQRQLCVPWSRKGTESEHTMQVRRRHEVVRPCGAAVWCGLVVEYVQPSTCFSGGCQGVGLVPLELAASPTHAFPGAQSEIPTVSHEYNYIKAMNTIRNE